MFLPACVYYHIQTYFVAPLLQTSPVMEDWASTASAQHPGPSLVYEGDVITIPSPTLIPTPLLFKWRLLGVERVGLGLK